MIVLHTSGLLAALDPDERRHEECAAVVHDSDGPLLLSPFVLAETDYLVRRNRGVDDELALLRQVAVGALQLVQFSPDDVRKASALIARYRDQQIGIADASVVVLAESHGTRDVLTLDERHFRVIRTKSGESLRLRPADG